MTLDQLTTFFGWAAIINIALLLVSAAALLVLRGPIMRIDTWLFGLDAQGQTSGWRAIDAPSLAPLSP